MNNTLIHCTDLNKSVLDSGRDSVTILQKINLTVGIGEFVSILGKSGSGKTTFLSILGLLDMPSSGEYFFQGISVKNMSSAEHAEIRNKKIGFVFQSFHLLPYLTLIENVCLPLVYQKIPHTERIQLAKQVLERVGLKDKINSLPNKISGGQKQRCAIARAIVTKPILLLADEPTGNLDTENGENILTLFKELVLTGTTIIMVTHDLNLAKSSHKIVKLQDGKIIS